MENNLERNIYQRAAYNHLKELAPLLDKMDITWWCEAGTCLGAVRDKDFIPHDSDIDIGIVEHSKSEYIKKFLYDKGWAFLREFGTPDNGYEMALSKHGVKVDLFFFYEEGSKLWHSAWVGKKQLFLDFPKDLILPVRREKFLDMEVNLPYNPEEYLTCRYGDWHKIVKDWRWDEDPKCLRK